MAAEVPPPGVRAFVITPVVFLGAGLVTLLSPVLHLVLALIDLVDRRQWRFTRVVGVGIAFCVVEFFGLILAFALWVLAGFGLWIRSGWMQDLHLKVVGIWLELITRALRFFLGFRFTIDFGDLRPGPVLIFCRHAGPGDSLLVARALVRDQHRKLRMLGTTKLLWDPFFNHLIRRMPFHFVDPKTSDPASELASIAEAAATIEDDGAMMVFPEGGNFTPGRRLRAIERFEERGQHARAERAERLQHVLPPRTASTLAAVHAAGNTEVAFVAHVGLDDLLSLGDIWRSVPLQREVRASWWYADKPDGADHEEAVKWLFDQWEVVDTWVDENAGELFEE